MNSKAAAEYGAGDIQALCEHGIEGVCPQCEAAEQAHEHTIECYNVGGFLDCEVDNPDASEPQAAPPDTIWLHLYGSDGRVNGRSRVHEHKHFDNDISYTRTSTADAAALKPHDVFLLLDEFEAAQEANYHIGKKRQLAEFIAARWEFNDAATI